MADRPGALLEPWLGIEEVIAEEVIAISTCPGLESPMLLNEDHARSTRQPAAAPAGGLVDAIPVVALALWILNDRVLKSACPGFLTGKLSDVAGLIVAPLAVQAAWEVIAWLAGRWTGPSIRVLAVAMIAVGVGFAAAQVWPPASTAFAWGLGFVQWPFRVIGAVATGAAPPALVPVVAVADAEDLMALPALVVTWWAGRQRLRP